MGPRVTLFAVCILFLFFGQIYAEDRDPTARDLGGIPRSHKYAWAVIGGTAVGAGLGVIAPGGTKSAVKGALIGGSLTSFIYLAKSPRAAEGHRGFAHIVTNTLLATGVFWTICDCGDGAWAGALIGGGGTAIVQAFGTHHAGLAKATGVGPTSQVEPPPAIVAPSPSQDQTGSAGNKSNSGGNPPFSANKNKNERSGTSTPQNPQLQFFHEQELDYY